MSLVVAYDQKRTIGLNGTIPWLGKLPADMKHFRQITIGGTVLMGRKTFESIGKPLVDRTNIVVTHDQGFEFPGVVVLQSLEAYQNPVAQEVFVIGGAQIYRQVLPYADRVYATEIETSCSGDTFFPDLDESWKEIDRERHLKDGTNHYNYSFVTYQRS